VKQWFKYALVGLFGFGLGVLFFSVAIKEPQVTVSGSAGINAGSRSSTFVANFQQRDMNPVERRLYPIASRMVTVELYIKSQYTRPIALVPCKQPRETDLVDGAGKSMSGVKVTSSFNKEIPPKGGANTQVCVVKYAFVVTPDKVMDDEWALVVDGSSFRKLNQIENVEEALASCDPMIGFSCPN
jgi:hypothetical protein